MIESIGTFLAAAVLEYKYLLLYPVTIVEGPLVAMAAGFAVQQGIMTWWIALPIIVLGDLTGDLIYYSIGRFGQRWRLTRWLVRYFRLEAHQERMTTHFDRHGGKLMLFGKLTHAIGAAFLVVAGYARMPVRWFLWYNFVGTVIKSSALLYVGVLAGAAYSEYAKRFEWIALVITAVSVVFVFVLPRFARYWFAPKEDRDGEGK